MRTGKPSGTLEAISRVLITCGVSALFQIDETLQVLLIMVKYLSRLHKSNNRIHMTSCKQCPSRILGKHADRKAPESRNIGESDLQANILDDCKKLEHYSAVAFHPISEIHATEYVNTKILQFGFHTHTHTHTPRASKSRIRRITPILLVSSGTTVQRSEVYRPQ